MQKCHRLLQFNLQNPRLPRRFRLADAAKREKQRRACLELAKDNPSIVCK